MQMRPFDVLCNLKNWTSWDYKAYKLSEEESKPCIKALENYIWHDFKLEGTPKEDGNYLCKFLYIEDNTYSYLALCVEDGYFPKKINNEDFELVAWRKIIDEE